MPNNNIEHSAAKSKQFSADTGKKSQNISESDSRLANAIAYAKKGWPVFPVGDKKLPAVKAWEQKATTDESRIRSWYENTSMNGCNFGFCPGRAGIAVIDLDMNKKSKDGNAVNGRDSLETFCGDQGETLPETYTVRTPSGGLHRYYKVPHEIRSKNAFLPAVDVKSSGGYVVIPGSVNANGGKYEVIRDVEVAQMPQWFLDIYGRQANAEAAKEKVTQPPADITADTQDKIERAIEIISGWKSCDEGERNTNLFQMMRELLKAGISEEKAAELYEDYGVDKIGLDPDSREVAATIASAYEDMADFGVESEEHGKNAAKLFEDLSAGEAAGITAEESDGEAAGITTEESESLLDRFRRRLHKGEYYLNLKETDLEYWVDGLLPAEDFLVDVCGAPGCGKSTFVHQLCICVLNGVDFLGHATHPETKSGKVFKPLIVSCEEPEKSIARRMKAQAEVLCGRNGKTPDVLDLLGEDTTFYQAGAKSGITDQLKAVMAVVKEGGYNFVAIDNRGEVFRADENNRDDVSRFCGPLKMACRSLRAQVVMLSHTNKQGKESGSTAWTGSGRVQIRMGTDNNREEIAIQVTKANDVATGRWETVKFMPKEGGKPGECLPVLIPTVARISEEDLLDMVVKAVEAAEAEGIARETLYKKLEKEQFFDYKRKKELVDLALKKGLIVLKTIDGLRRLHPKASE